MWLLDTMTICEPTKTVPDERVLDWINAQPGEKLYTSVLCLGEIRRGVERLPGGARRTRLRQWMDKELPAWFMDRVLPIDAQTAQIWGELTAAASRTLPVIDSLIGATALKAELTIVTRNVKDYESFEVEVLNPWED